MNIYSETTLGTQEPKNTEITIVGMEFIAGMEGNIKIAEAKGYSVCISPNGDVFHTIDGLLMEPIPDYCGDDALSIELMEGFGVVPFVVPTEKPKGARKFVPGFVAVFEISDTLYMTVPQVTEEAASACALWFVLGISHD